MSLRRLTGAAAPRERGSAVALDRPASKGRGRTRRRKVALGCGVVLGLLVLGVIAVVAFIGIREWRSPSGKVFVETDNGRVELQIPDVIATPPEPSSVDLSAVGPVPPTDLEIPSAGVSTKVFLMTDQPPNFPAAGWLFGTAMPGTKGNVVLYGARAGPAAVFEKLDQVRPGDKITVVAETVAYVYEVTTIDEVMADRTDLLLPTEEPVVTLVTDAGEWDAAANRYTKRLVVRGRYVGAEPWSGS